MSSVINMFLNYSEAKRSRHSRDTVEELKLLFPKGCDIMGITTPGIVCKYSTCLSQSSFLIHREENKPNSKETMGGHLRGVI